MNNSEMRELMQQLQGSSEKDGPHVPSMLLSHAVGEDGVKVDREDIKNFIVNCDASRKVFILY